MDNGQLAVIGSKKIYRYAGVMPPQYNRLRQLIKAQAYGMAWQLVRQFECIEKKYIEVDELCPPF